MPEPKVDFFVCGAQKAGTTALDAMLRQMPGVQMGRIKEAHYFDDESIDWSAPDRRRLHAMFDWTQADSVRGEATPIYTYWPAALERLRQYNPSAVLIMGLREPGLRAYSHWRMERSRGSDAMNFHDSIRSLGRRRLRDAPLGVHRVYSYVERGFYAAQVERMLRLFPRRNVIFYRTDVLIARPAYVLDRIRDRLGIDREAIVRSTYTTPTPAAEFEPIPDADRCYLRELYRDDIYATERLTGIELRDWLEDSYREPIAGEATYRLPGSSGGASRALPSSP